MGTHERKPLIGDGWLFQRSVCLWLFKFFANFWHLSPPILAIKNSQNSTSISLYLQNRVKEMTSCSKVETMGKIDTQIGYGKYTCTISDLALHLFAPDAHPLITLILTL